MRTVFNPTFGGLKLVYAVAIFINLVPIAIEPHFMEVLDVEDKCV